MNCGIVGLPNVGKSTLFNALTQTAAAQAANYPFCTIEPNIGKVFVPDDRLNILADLAKSVQKIPTQLEIVDIAGLVKGASKGEGLGNQFLAHIREVDAILHVLRCFEDSSVTHVEENIDPLRDLGIVETELILADLDSLERREASLNKRIKEPDFDIKIALIKKLKEMLNSGLTINKFLGSFDEWKIIKEFQLITSKPVLYICNVAESETLAGNSFTNEISLENKIIISAAIEAEIAAISDINEQKIYLEDMGLTEPGLARVIRGGYYLLQLITFFTIGPKEARAWTIKKGAKAPEAAGVIHSDFEKGFICAETISFNDYVEFKNEQNAKAAGRCRLEGRDYVVQDGDVFHFRFNV